MDRTELEKLINDSDLLNRFDNYIKESKESYKLEKFVHPECLKLCTHFYIGELELFTNDQLDNFLINKGY